MSNVLFLDNFDSFSYNLVDEFRRAGARVEVWRNDAALDDLLTRVVAHDLLVLSPGPGRPEDAGILVALIEKVVGHVPIFGVCLGMQAIAVALGGELGAAPRRVHGKTGSIYHHEGALFSGLDNPFVAGRYHSSVVRRAPADFAVTAWVQEAGERVTMALEDRERRLLGVQFHPESILTRNGSRLIERVLRWAAQHHAIRRAGSDHE